MRDQGSLALVLFLLLALALALALVLVRLPCCGSPRVRAIL